MTHARTLMDDLLIAVSPDPDSRLPDPLRLPFGSGWCFAPPGTWPRTKARYCYPVSVGDWPTEPEIIELVPVRSCVRRGATIDLVLDRGPGEPLPAGVRHCPRPGRGVLAVAAHPQAGPAQRLHAHRSRRRHRAVGDRRGHLRAVLPPVRHPAGGHGQAPCGDYGITIVGSTATGAGSPSRGCSARYSVDLPILRWRAMAVTDSPRDCRARATASTSSSTLCAVAQLAAA